MKATRVFDQEKTDRRFLFSWWSGRVKHGQSINTEGTEQTRAVGGGTGHCRPLQTTADR